MVVIGYIATELYDVQVKFVLELLLETPVFCVFFPIKLLILKKKNILNPIYFQPVLIVSLIYPMKVPIAFL